MVWANPAMKTYLNRPSGLLSHFEHGLAFTNGVAGRLLDKDVSTHLHGCNAGKGMPMVRSGDNDDFRFFRLQHVLIIAVDPRPLARLLFHLIQRCLQWALIDIAQANDLASS